MYQNKDLLFRFTLGQQDTVALSLYNESKYADMLWLAKLSMVSFQKWFPNATFLMLYNGISFESFKEKFLSTKPDFLTETIIINQNTEQFVNKYLFQPLHGGVWMKWIPFRYDITKTEIAVDTDIICINNPTTWAEWINNEGTHILVAPERLSDVCMGSCGDFHDHPLLKDKKAINCGVVGQRKGYNYEDRFFEVAQSVDYGTTKNSLFITEQGAINLWLYSLKSEGVPHTVLDFQKNCFGRDFLYFLSRGISVETVHAVSWQKRVIKIIKPHIERKVLEGYPDKEFLHDVLQVCGQIPKLISVFLAKQITGGDIMKHDFLIQDGSSFK